VKTEDDAAQWQRSTFRVMVGTAPGTETGFPKYHPDAEERAEYLKGMMENFGFKKSMEKAGFSLDDEKNNKN